jgi:rhodanese-related sulfurtransferase
MNLVNHQSLQEWDSDTFLCIDIRERNAHKVAPTKGGIHVPYDELPTKKALLLPHVAQKVVIFSQNYPNRCNRVRVAEKHLRAIGFTEVYGIENGLALGWTMPNLNAPLPGINLRLAQR